MRLLKQIIFAFVEIATPNSYSDSKSKQILQIGIVIANNTCYNVKKQKIIAEVILLKRNWLIEIRKEKRLTQKAIADEVGITRQMFSAIENGQNTGIKTAKKIASFLDFEWTDFYKEVS